MIKAIIFDYGNVICYFTNEIFVEKIAKIAGKPPEVIKKLIYQDSDIGKRFERGELSGQQFYEELSQICGINVPCSLRGIKSNLF